jgi:hypothetical protein
MVRKKSRLMVILIILFCVGWTVELWSADEPTLGQESVADNEDQIQSQMVALIKAISKERHQDGVIRCFNQSKSLLYDDLTPRLWHEYIEHHVFTHSGP